MIIIKYLKVTQSSTWLFLNKKINNLQAIKSITTSRATVQAHRAIDKRKQVAVGAVEHSTKTEQTITSVSREIEQQEQQTAEMNCAVRETDQALGQGVER